MHLAVCMFDMPGNQISQNKGATKRKLSLPATQLQGINTEILSISDKCVNQTGQCTLACSRFESALFQILVPINSNITITFILRAIHLWPASCHYRPGQSKDRFNGKVRAANESYSRKMNIITIITHFCEFLQLNRMHYKKL